MLVCLQLLTIDRDKYQGIIFGLTLLAKEVGRVWEKRVGEAWGSSLGQQLVLVHAPRWSCHPLVVSLVMSLVVSLVMPPLPSPPLPFPVLGPGQPPPSPRQPGFAGL